MSIHTSIHNHTAVITLDRPKALNALNHEMVKEMTRVLEEWRDDEDITMVVLRGAGERALCAGGDIASLYEDAKAGGSLGEEFWRDEYRLNDLIANYPKPYVAIMHGIVLGGGVGVSAHGSHRIVTDSTRIGMPEVGIGFVPDVGGTYLLSRAGELGRYLALSARHVGAVDAIRAGLADVYVPEERLEELLGQLCATGLPSVIDDFAQPLEEEGVDASKCVGETVAEILANLDEDDAKRIRRHCPTALAVTLASLQRAANMDLKEALNAEFGVSLRMQARADFVEGVRAQIIDKDRSPAWCPAFLDDVHEEAIEEILSPVDCEYPFS